LVCVTQDGDGATFGRKKRAWDLRVAGEEGEKRGPAAKWSKKERATRYLRGKRGRWQEDAIGSAGGTLFVMRGGGMRSHYGWSGGRKKEAHFS